jgi:nicotinamidase-related amidase
MTATVANRTVFTTLGEMVQPAHTALLLIDLQNDLIGESGFCAKRRPDDVARLRTPLPDILKLHATARSAGVMTVYIKLETLPGGAAETDANLSRLLTQWNGTIPDWATEGTWGSEFIPELPAPTPRDVVVRKRRQDSFTGTDLDLVLRSHGIRSVVILGVTTSGCVMYTARDAMMHGYYVIVPTDCVGSQREDWHDATIVIMKRLFNYVGPSDAVAEAWSSSRKLEMSAAGARA